MDVACSSRARKSRRWQRAWPSKADDRGTMTDEKRNVPTGDGFIDAEIFDAVQSAARGHITMARPLISGLGALVLDENIHLRSWGKTLHPGIYHYTAPNDSADDTTGSINSDAVLLCAEFDWEAIRDEAEAIRDEAEAAIESGRAAELPDGTIVLRGDEKPTEFKLRLLPIKVDENRAPLTFWDLAVWAAINDAEEAGNSELAHAIFRRFYRAAAKPRGRRRERKSETANNSVTMSTTKVEKTVFGDVPQDKRISVERYTGEDVRVDLRSGPAWLALKTEKPVENMTAAERAEAQLTSIERFWLTALTSCAYDNPEKLRFYGSDLLKRWGYKKPLRPGSAETMEQCARAITKLTHTSIWIDTTADAKSYADRGRVVRRVTDRRIVNGNVSIERYEDGTVDFYVDLQPTGAGTATSALPLFEYAADKRQLLQADSSIYEFRGVRKITAEHRRVMEYIYRQVYSRGLGNDMRLGTIMERCGIEDNKDKRYKLCRMLEKLLNCWVEGGVIESWKWKYRGRTRHALSVIPA